MSELMNTRNGTRDFRWQLLATASAWALLTAVYGSSEAKAADQDADRPTVWIELGGQLEQMKDGQQPFAPPFVANLPNNFFSPLSVQKSLQYSLGGEGSVLFEPEESDWILSASVRFGRSNGTSHRHQQTPNAKIPVHATQSGFVKYQGTYYPSRHAKFADAKASQSESHAVLDFQAGKDVGLGMFGGHGSSVLSTGVRIAQFNSESTVNINALPDLQYPNAPLTSVAAVYAFKHTHIHFHAYTGLSNIQRGFQGIGPSVAWKASAPFAGNPERAELTFDWGMNAAILFGRQKASGHHQTTVRSYYVSQWKNAAVGCGNNACFRPGYFTNTHKSHYNPAQVPGVPYAQHSNAAGFNRMRSVLVPNLGGFAGVSFLYSNAKVSLGYRADFFFGAMDGGIDAARKENQGFYGPFASVSVGIGG